jgi:hypothetical protein
VRCARCEKVWFATTPTLVTALATVGDLDIVDNGPRFPAYDEDIPRDEADSITEWNDSPGLPDDTAVEAAPEQMAMKNPVPELGSTEGIDLNGLSAEIEAERAEQDADADRVLAEITGDVPLAEGPSLVPPMEPEGMREAVAEPATIVPETAASEDIETFAARRLRRGAIRRRRWSVPGLPTAILVLVAINAALVGWRHDVVRMLPQTAALYAKLGIPVNLRGLTFENIKMSKETLDGVPVLVVEGSIVNVAGKAVEVPRVRLAVRNESKNEIYTWTTLPSRGVLGPNEVLPFRSRLASPPVEARDVLVRFFNRNDMVAGIR